MTNVALVHNKDKKVIRTGLPITPQVGPSGLCPTPTELAEIAIEIQNALRNKKQSRFSQCSKSIRFKTSCRRLGLWLATMKDENSFAFLANGEKPNRIPVIVNTQKKILSLMNWKGNFNNEEVQEIPAVVKAKLIETYSDFLYWQESPTQIFEKKNRIYVDSDILQHFKGKNQNELFNLKNGCYKIVDYLNLLKLEFKK